MKKNVKRITAIVALLAIMICSLTACTYKIDIVYVDQSGNPIDANATVATTAAPTTVATTAATTAAPTAAPATPDSAATSGNSATPVDATTGNAPTSAVADSGAMPTDTASIADFYKKAVAKVKDNGEAGYTKKEWQALDEINIGSSVVNNAVSSLAGSFMTVEDKAEDQVLAKGSQESKDYFPIFSLTDYSKIANATCSKNASGNYDITMTFVDEDTPKKDSNFLGQVTNSVLYWDDIENTLKNDSKVTAVLKDYSDIHVIYQGYEITAEITPDGQFVSMKHLANANIQVGMAKILMFTVENKSATLVNTCTYNAFQY